MNEFLRLKEMLEKANIPFEFNSRENQRFYQLVLHTNMKLQICNFSIDNEENLLEIHGALTKEEDEYNNTIDNLTAEEVFKRFKYCYENKTDIYVPEPKVVEPKDKKEVFDLIEWENGDWFIIKDGEPILNVNEFSYYLVEALNKINYLSKTGFFKDMLKQMADITKRFIDFVDSVYKE